MAGLQTGVPAHDLGYRGMVHVVTKRITFAQGAVETTVCRLPANASILPGSGVHVITAFNDSGTDLLDVGLKSGSSTDDPNAYGTALAMSAIGFIALDELAATTNIKQTVESLVTCTYTGENTNATAGVADVIIVYATKP